MAFKRKQSDFDWDAMETEVQALLVGADLSSLTLGQLRAQLEDRLGLPVGTLGKSRHVRRRIGHVVQIEVTRKTFRTSDCERVTKALIEFKEYPACTRQMLIDSLPQALVCDSSGARHPHQVRLLEIVRDAVLDAQAISQRKWEASKALVLSNEQEATRADTFAAEASAEEARLAEAVVAASKRTKEAADVVRQVEDEVQQAALAEQSAVAAEADVLKQRQRLVSVVSGPLQALLEGTWDEEVERDAALKTVRKSLVGLEVESAMMTAVPVALCRLPDERSAFENVTANYVREVFASKLKSLDEQLETLGASRVSVETTFIASAAILGAAEDNAKELDGLQADAEQAALAARADRCTADATAAAQHMKVRACRADEVECHSRVDEITATVAIVERLVAGGDDPALVAKEAELVAVLATDVEPESFDAVDASFEAAVEANAVVSGDDADNQADADSQSSSASVVDSQMEELSAIQPALDITTASVVVSPARPPPTPQRAGRHSLSGRKLSDTTPVKLIKLDEVFAAASPSHDVSSI